MDVGNGDSAGRLEFEHPKSDVRVYSPDSHRELFVVALGASAGGLEALEKFFDNMPADSGLASSSSSTFRPISRAS